MPQNDRDYFTRRAQTARSLAEKAADPSVRQIHERMAKDYAARAEASVAQPRLDIVAG